MRGVVVVMVCVAAAMAVACVDVEGGDSAYYGSPCNGGGFAELLLCGRESGGADPRAPGVPGGESSGVATCDDACEVIVTCIGGDGADLAECTSDCYSDSGVSQGLLECIVANGCNYYQACVGSN